MILRQKFTSSESFCVAPWIHAHVRATGERALCCVAEPSDKVKKFTTYEEFRNSDYLKSIRKMMMSGKLPAECAICLKPNRNISYRKELNKRFRHLIKSIEKGTSIDGTTNLRPAYLDYRSDKCNLSCRTCGEHSSTAWQTHMIKKAQLYTQLGWDIEGYKKLWDSNAQKSESFSDELFQLAQEKQVTDIYFAGGEPTMAPKHLDLLMSLAQTKKSKSMSLAYNTNLSRTHEFLKEWISLLGQFWFSFISISIDGVFENAEYVRSGLKWKTFESNLNFLVRNKPWKSKLYIDPTITSLFLTDLIRFTEYFLKYNLPIQPKLMICGEKLGLHLRPEFLPKSVRSDLIDAWLTYYANLPFRKRRLLKIMRKALLIAREMDSFDENLFPTVFRAMKTGDEAHQNGSFEELICREPRARFWLEQMKNKYLKTSVGRIDPGRTTFHQTDLARGDILQSPSRELTV